MNLQFSSFFYFEKLLKNNRHSKSKITYQKARKNFLLLCSFTFLSFCVQAQDCGSEGFELLIETSLGTGQVCENSVANVSVDVTPESFYSLDQIDSIRWLWYVDLPGQAISFDDILGGADTEDTTFPPFGSIAENSHLYDELTNLGCDILNQLEPVSPNIIEMSIGTFGYVTCDDGTVESHFNTVGFDLLLAPRSDLEIMPSTICLNETVNLINTGCFGDPDMSYWTSNGNIIQTNGNDILEYSPDGAGSFEVCLRLVNSCGEDEACKTLTVIPEPDALFSIPPALSDGTGCADVYEFCNTSDTINHYNLEYYWGVYLNGSLLGQIDTHNYKTCYTENFTTPGEYELVLTATNFVCDTAQHSFTFTILESPTVILSDTLPFCSTTFTGYTPSVSYEGDILSYFWTFDSGTPATSNEPFPSNIMFPPGSHSVTIEIESPCGTISDSTTVTIDSPENITFNSFEDTLCTGQGDTLKVIPSQLNGTWNSAAFINDSCLVIDNLPIGSNTFTYTAGSGACTSTATINIFITDTTAIVFTLTQEIFCEDDGIITLDGYSPPGGTWSGMGVIDSNIGLIDASIIGAGNTVTLWYSFINSEGCESLASKTVTIEGLPQAALPQDSLLLCDIPGDVNLNDELGIPVSSDYSDEWIGNCVTPDGILDPVCLGIGTFILEYVVITPNNCTDTTDITIIVDSFQLANAGEDFSECVTEGATITLTGSPAGGTWMGPNISPDGVITIDATLNGDYEYFYTFGGANCENQDAVTVTFINLNGVSANPLNFCEDAGIIVLPDGMPIGGTWLYNGAALPNNELNITALGAGDFILEYEVEVPTSANDTCVNAIPVNLFIDALPNPIIEIPADLCINEIYTIINNTTEEYNSWSWDFGNGTTATGLNPTFEYTSTGDYVITLEIQDTICLQVFTWNVAVSSPPPPLDFAINILSADSCELLEVAFVNQSQVDPNVTDVIYIWDFGNGVLDTTYSVSEVPDNVFFEAYEGDTIYTVTLSALNNCGAVIPAIATVYVKPIPISQFSADFESYCSGATANFVNSSVGNPDHTIIDLGDGSPLLYDYPFDTLSHQYFVGDVAETFTVQFISFNDCGQDTIVFFIEVVPVDVVAAFTVEDNGIFCQNTPFCFTNAASPGAEVWYDMGDGNAVYTSDTCYVYSQEGSYTITQFALDNCGGLDTLQIPVTVLLSPEIVLPNFNDPCLGDTTEFSIAMLSDDVIGVNWDFGDGNSSDEQNPKHVFQNPGIYVVTATAMTNESCTTTDSVIIEIEELIDISIAMEDLICANEPIDLVNTSGGSGYACTWLLDQTTFVAGCSIVESFETEGVHNITLTLTDNTTGCESKKDTIVFVRPTPTAAYGIEQLDSCNQNNYRFTDLSTSSNTVFWDFGDGTNSSQADIIEHVYSPADSYLFTMVASYDSICFDTLSQIIEVPESLASIFNIPDLNGCDLFTPTILNQSTGNNLIYNWSTSNGLNFFQQQIAPDFTTDFPSENITIQLIVTDEVTNCADTSAVEITVFDTPTVSLNTEDVSCNGGSDGTIGTTVSGGSPNFQYGWSVPGNTETIENLSAGTYTVTISDSNNCSVVDSVEITQPTPIAITLDDIQDATCAGKEDGSITISANGGTTTTGNEFNYEWSIDLPLAGAPFTTISELGSGFYIVTVTDELGCTEEETFTIADGYALEVLDTILGISCENRIDGEIQIAAIQNGFPNFLALLEGTESDTINSDAGIFNFKNLPAGGYQLTIIDQNNCIYESEYQVPAWQDPELNVFVDKEEEPLYRCDSALIVANGIGSNLTYQWFPQVSLSCLNGPCDSVKVSPNNDITYVLTAIDERGCVAIDSIPFTVDEDRTLYVPTAFTPNGDGVNDIFRIRAGEHQAFLLSEISRFNISDRWGNILFTTESFHPFKNPEIGWNGQIEDVEAPSDIYAYWAELKFCDGDTEVIKGRIQLIR